KKAEPVAKNQRRPCSPGKGLIRQNAQPSKWRQTILFGTHESPESVSGTFSSAALKDSSERQARLCILQDFENGASLIRGEMSVLWPLIFTQKNVGQAFVDATSRGNGHRIEDFTVDHEG